MRRTLSASLLLATALLSAAGSEKIMRPVDGAALASGQIDFIATAVDGRLELDGKPLEALEPFPNVLHAPSVVEAGEHTLVLKWAGGETQVRFFVGENPPAGFEPYFEHPPVADVACTQCHGVSRRGRFRFEGGCFDCHAQEKFSDSHPHAAHVLEQCGLCHNAHGSTAKALMLYPRETACQQCHGL